MFSKTFKESIKFKPTFLTSIGFFILYFVAVILFSGRSLALTHFTLFENFLPDFYLHISNFSISVLLYLPIGFLWLLLGVKGRFILLLSIPLFLFNVLYEKYSEILNTPDIIDAYYGITGTFITLIYLISVYYFGLVKKENN